MKHYMKKKITDATQEKTCSDCQKSTYMIGAIVKSLMTLTMDDLALPL